MRNRRVGFRNRRKNSAPSPSGSYCNSLFYIQWPISTMQRNIIPFHKIKTLKVCDGVVVSEKVAYKKYTARDHERYRQRTQCVSTVKVDP